MRFSILILLLSLLLVSTPVSQARRDGVPDCVEQPGHGVEASYLNDKYFLAINSTSITPGEPVQVSLRSLDADFPFRGFAVAAFDDNNQRVGRFILGKSQDSTQYKFSPCPKSRGITHVTNSDKLSVDALWVLDATEPWSEGASTIITFRGVMVQDTSAHWPVSFQATRTIDPSATPGQPMFPPRIIEATTESLTLSWASMPIPNVGPFVQSVSVTASVNGTNISAQNCDSVSLVPLTNRQGNFLYSLTDSSCVLADASLIKPGTIVEVAMFARNQVGNGPLSVPTFYAIPSSSNPPIAVNNLIVTATTTSQITIKWTQPTFGTINSYVIGYNVYYRPLGAGPSFISEHRVDASDLNLYPGEIVPRLPAQDTTINALIPDTEYEVYVVANSFAGESEKSELVRTRTQPLEGSNLNCNPACEQNGGECQFGECFCNTKDSMFYVEKLGPDCSIPAVTRCFPIGIQFCFSWAAYKTTNGEQFLDISLFAKSTGWIGVMFDANDQRMGQADTWLAWYDKITGTAIAVDAYSESTGVPPVSDESIGGKNNLINVRGKQDKGLGTTIVQFSRRVTVPASSENDYSFDMKSDKPVLLSWAHGNLDSSISDTLPINVHLPNDKNRGVVKLDMSSVPDPNGGLNIIDSSSGLRAQLILVHAVCMLLAFGVMFPTGIAIALRSKVAATYQFYIKRMHQPDPHNIQTPPSTGYFRSDVSSFKLHRGMQVLGSVVVIIATASVFSAPGRSFRSNFQAVQNSHSSVGVLLLIMLVAQVFVAIFFKSDTAHKYHRLNGILMLLVVFLKQIPSGLALEPIISFGSPGIMVIVLGAAWAAVYIGIYYPLIKRSLNLQATAHVLSDGVRIAKYKSMTWKSIVTGIHKTNSEWFYRTGIMSARSPWKVIAISVGSCMILALGWLKMTRLTKFTDLYVPTGVQALDDLGYLESNFPVITSEAFVFHIVAPEGESVLSAGTLLAVLDIQHRIESYVEPSSNTSLELVCDRQWDASPCDISSILQLWGHSDVAIRNDPSIQQTVSVNTIPNPPLPGIPIENVLGGIERDEHNKVISARAIKVEYRLLPREVSSDFEIGALELLSTLEPSVAKLGLKLTWISNGAIGRALNESISSDIYLFILATTTMILFSAASLGEADAIRSKVTVAGCGVFGVIISIAAGMGLAMFLGFPFTSIHSILAFIIIGIGLDDMYIIVASMRFETRQEYHRARTGQPPEWNALEERLASSVRAASTLERIIARGLSNAGPSIWMTSVTDAFAFAAGVVSILPSVSSFCAFSALCVIVDFVMQITFFIAVLVLDARRQQQGKADVFCCCTLDTLAKFDRISYQAEGHGIVDPGERFSDNQQAFGSDDEKKLESRHGDIRMADRFPLSYKWFTRLVLSFPAKIVFWILGTGMAIVLGFHAFSVESFLDTISVVRDSSPIKRAYNVNTKFFSLLQTSRTTVVAFSDVQFADPTSQAKILWLEAQVVKDSPEATTYSWLQGVIDHAAKDVRDEQDLFVQTSFNGEPLRVLRKEVFYESLQSFLRIPYVGSIYKKNMNFVCGNEANTTTTAAGCVLESAASIVQVKLKEDNTNLLLDRMARGRQDCSRIVTRDETCVVFNGGFVTGELYKRIPTEVLICLGGALVAVGCISMIVMVEPSLGILCTIMVALIDLETVGVMSLVGIPLNPVTLLVLNMSIGLSFDYVGHITHGFMHTRSTRLEARSRAEGRGYDSLYELQSNCDRDIAESMIAIGPSVLRSAVSTFLGIVFLALADAAVFRTLFAVFAIVICLSVFHSFLLVPVVISTIRPVLDRRNHPEVFAKELADAGIVTRRSVHVPLTDDTDITDFKQLAPRQTGYLVMLGCRTVMVIIMGVLLVLVAIGAFKTPEVNLSPVTELVPNQPSNKTLDMLIGSYQVPQKRTTYVCKGFAHPLTDAKYHMTEAEPVIDNKEVLHHMVLFSCTSPYPTSPQLCGTMPRDCQQVVVTWSIGGKAQVFPDYVGIPLGRNTVSSYLTLQMHYDNFYGTTGIVDNSGFRLKLSKQYRKYEAGSLYFGANLDLLETLPPGEPTVHRAAKCPPSASELDPTASSTQLADLIGPDQEYITLLSGMPHMHELGKEMHVHVYGPDGNERAALIVDTTYSYDAQRYVPLGDFKLYKNDTLYVRCTYDTTPRLEPIAGGDETNNEMCLLLTYYYPRSSQADEDFSLGFCVGDTRGFTLPSEISWEEQQ